MKVAAKVMVKMIRGYQKLLSPLKSKRSCRFHPTCSTYAINALTKYGFWQGTWLAIKRILKCHPFNSGGYDPVD